MPSVNYRMSHRKKHSREDYNQSECVFRLLSQVSWSRFSCYICSIWLVEFQKCWKVLKSAEKCWKVMKSAEKKRDKAADWCSITDIDNVMFKCLFKVTRSKFCYLLLHNEPLSATSTVPTTVPTTATRRLFRFATIGWSVPDPKPIYRYRTISSLQLANPISSSISTH